MMKQHTLTIGMAALLATTMVIGSGCQTTPTSAMKSHSHTKSHRPARGPYDKPGFKVEVEDGRLWVLRLDEEKSEKHITLVGAGPAGMTVKALSRATALEYLARKPGFAVDVDEDGRIWVFPAGSPMEKSEKHITRVGAGPMGATLKAVDKHVLDAYVAAGD